MKSINTQKLLHFIDLHNISEEFEEFLDDWNYPSFLKIKRLTPKIISEASEKINNSSNLKTEEEIGEAQCQLSQWKKGQFRLFFWLLAFYCFSHHLQVEQITKKDVEFFSEIFLRQNPERIWFEIKHQNPLHFGANTSWTKSQSALLENIVKAKQALNLKIEWKKVAFELFCRTETSQFRTGPKCRQRWTNHLNPNVNRDKWTPQQDCLLLKKVKEYGQKWSLIVKFLGSSRTEHMVKNRFRSLVQNCKKNHPQVTVKQAEDLILKEVGETVKNPEDSCSEEMMLEDPLIKTSRGINAEMKSQGEGAEESSEIFSSSSSLESANYYSDYGCEVIQNSRETMLVDKIDCCKDGWNFNIDYFEMGLNYSKDTEVKNLINDVADILGYEHPEQIDMFFEFDESPRTFFDFQ